MHMFGKGCQKESKEMCPKMMVRALMLSGLKTVVLWKRQEVELEVAKVKMFSFSNQDGSAQG